MGNFSVVDEKRRRRREGSVLVYGWGRGIRTPTGGVRVRCPTIRRSPKILFGLTAKLSLNA